MGTVKVIFESTFVDVRSGVKNDRPWTIRSQPARLQGQYIAGPVSIQLSDNQPAYEVGAYELDLEKSISISNFGNINVSRTLTLHRIEPSIASMPSLSSHK